MTKEAVKEIILAYFENPVILEKGQKRLKALDEHLTGKPHYTGVTIPYIRYYLFDNTVSFNVITEVLTEMVKDNEISCLHCMDVDDLVYEIKGSTPHWAYNFTRLEDKRRYNEYISKYNSSLVEIPNCMKEVIIKMILHKIDNFPRGKEKNKLQQLLHLFTSIHNLNEFTE